VFLLLCWQCNKCERPLIQLHDRLNFFSDYSHPLTCSHCHTRDTHFVKPLHSTFVRSVYEPSKRRGDLAGAVCLPRAVAVEPNRRGM
jgi:Headcase protein